MTASTVVLVIVTPLNVGMNIWLIHHTPLGLFGSPIALTITYWIAFLLLSLFTYFSPKHRKNGTWAGIQLRVVVNWRGCWSFLKLAIPGILMIGTEWYVYLSYHGVG
jgi:multidrug resistance protein, MATE family